MSPPPGHRPRRRSGSRFPPPDDGRVLVIGGAGFVGTNVAARHLERGDRVLVYDSLARPGVERNLEWLASRHPDAVDVEVADLRDTRALRRAVRASSRIFHLAGQVAVTSSLEDPREDFDVNLRGTLGLLELLRELRDPPPLVFSSTNKVYGALSDVPLRRRDGRYEPVEASLRGRGIAEDRQLRFHSPYGCSKGGADQYVLDYARTFDLPTVVFRMSCIYGPHQHGTEDQGWVAHFLHRALAGEPITIYGDGRQVRDILFVEDLVEAMKRAVEAIDEVAGRAFNVGGGPGRAVSLLDVLELLEEITGRRPDVCFGPWRPGDQRWYVSDTRRFRDAVGWVPSVGVEEGLGRLHRWMRGRLSSEAVGSNLMEAS